MLYRKLDYDFLKTPVGEISVIPASLSLDDYIGLLKVRLNIGRMKYAITSGLYAIGQPDENSPVLVTANYKLTFDVLRKELKNINAWILVLDTKGINVWCAAGKGTFGTRELVNRINKTGLKKVVNHRNLLVPQLGAVGVSAHEVKNISGFNVIYGPIRAKDIPEFIASGHKSTESMKTVRFNIWDRLVLIPLEFVQGFKYIFYVMIVLFILSGLSSSGFSVSSMLTIGGTTLLTIFIAYLNGTILTPLFLPFLPARSFAMKGFIWNSLTFILLMQFCPDIFGSNVIEKLGWFLITSSIASFFAMNFTGASTYTSLSGVKREMKIAVPLQIISLAFGFILWMIKRFV